MKIHAGDFAKGETGAMGWNNKYIVLKRKGDWWREEKVRLEQVMEVERASEETVKRIGGTIGWGVGGAVLLGPAGLLAGLLVGSKRTDVTFVCKLEDGRKFIGTAESDDFKILLGAAFDYKTPETRAQEKAKEKEEEAKWKEKPSVFVFVLAAIAILLGLLAAGMGTPQTERPTDASTSNPSQR